MGIRCYVPAAAVIAVAFSPPIIIRIMITTMIMTANNNCNDDDDKDNDKDQDNDNDNDNDNNNNRRRMRRKVNMDRYYGGAVCLALLQHDLLRPTSA